MPNSKVELLMHPARFQIMEALTRTSLTTQELADRLSSIPKSSIYRHLRVLLDAGMVEVVETRPIKGVEEKVYRLAKPPVIDNEDMQSLSAEENLQYFNSYLATLLQGYSDYLEANPTLDMLADRAGYTEVIVYANTEELDRFAEALREAIRPLVMQEPGNGRHTHKISVITHPVKRRDE